MNKVVFFVSLTLRMLFVMVWFVTPLVVTLYLDSTTWILNIWGTGTAVLLSIFHNVTSMALLVFWVGDWLRGPEYSGEYEGGF